MVAQNRGSVVLFSVPTLKEAVPPPPPPPGGGDRSVLCSRVSMFPGPQIEGSDGGRLLLVLEAIWTTHGKMVLPGIVSCNEIEISW